MKQIISLWSILLLLTMGCKKENIKPDLNFTSESHGCSSFTVYKVNKDNEVAVAVIGNRNKLNLTTSEKSFNLNSINANELRVEINRFKGYAKSYYCNDVENAAELISHWPGKSGTVKIRIVQDSIGTNLIGGPGYKINVTIDNVAFENENEKKVSIDNLEFKEVLVGWLPG